MLTWQCGNVWQMANGTPSAQAMGQCVLYSQFICHVRHWGWQKHKICYSLPPFPPLESYVKTTLAEINRLLSCDLFLLVLIFLLLESWLIFVIFGLLSFSWWWASSQLRSDQLIFSLSLWLCLCSHLYSSHEVTSDWLENAAPGLSLVALISHLHTPIIKHQSNLFVSNQN